jgi:Fe-S-cluster containining protein
MNGAGSFPADEFRREAERLKRRVIHAAGRGGEEWRRGALLYRLADSYGRRVFPRSLCSEKVSAFSGCVTGECCRCRPDVFAAEKALLDRLPRPSDNGGYCLFFNRAKKTCGIYGVRPFACRIYYNLASSRLYCQNPAEETLQLFDTLKRHVEKILGPHLGGYLPHG